MASQQQLAQVAQYASRVIEDNVRAEEQKVESMLNKLDKVRHPLVLTLAVRAVMCRHGIAWRGIVRCTCCFPCQPILLRI